jgi:hypothetical protein
MSKEQLKFELPIFLKQQIKPDKHEDYSFTDQHIFSDNFSEYFDGEEKIISIVQKNKYLAIQVFTSRQINLFLDISVHRNIDYIEINATQSPVVIDGEFYANKAIKIKSESLAIYQDMQGAEAIELEVAGAISFEKLLKTNFLSVSADQFENLGNLYIGRLANFAVKKYIQSVQAQAKADGAWCFSGEYCQLAGQFEVQEKLYIKTQKLVLGEEGLPSSILVKGNIYLNTDDLETYPHTVYEMKQIVATDHPNFIVNSHFSLNKGSKVSILNAKIILNRLDNIGDFHAGNCEIGIRQCYQKNKLDFINSIVAFEDFVQHDSAITQIEDAKDSKKLIVKNMDINAGQLVLKKVNSLGVEWNIRQGALVITDSTVGIEQNFNLFNPAQTQLLKSTIKVNQVLMLNGAIRFNDCHIHCQTMDSQGYLSKSLIQNSHINAQKEIIIWKNLQIDHTKISSYQFSIKGELQAERVELNIAADATWKMLGKSAAKKIQLLADQINFYSTESSGSEAACFSESVFHTKLINHKGVTQFLNSKIYAYGEGLGSHSIQGDMQLLQNSKFYTDGQTYHYEKSKTKLDAKSIFQAQTVVNSGQIDITDACLTSTLLLQDQAEFKSKSSLINVRDTIYNRDSRMSVEDKSRVSAKSIMSSASELNLTDSDLVLQDSMMITEDSKMTGSKSFIDVPMISFAGSVQLSKTHLKGQDLIVFNQFSVSDGSLIEIGKSMQAAWQSIFTLEKSTLMGGKVKLSGSSTIDDSRFRIQKIETQVLSNTTLLGSSIIEARDIILNDKLKTESKEIKDNNNEEPRKLIPQLVAEDHLIVNKSAHISGNDLITESQQMEVEGEIKLSAHLIAKGGKLTNTGHIEAEKRIFLGFDDYVRNERYLSADEVIIHSNLLNIFGKIRARENFTNSGFFSLNLGIYQSPTTVINSLFSLNAGLILPDFSKGLSSIFNPRNLLTAGRIALSTALPQYANWINLAFTLPNLAGMSQNLYDVFQKYRDGELTWQSLSRLRRHELMPKICQIKSSAMFLYNACQSRSTATDFDWFDLGKQMVSSLGGSYIDESFMHLNTGLSATHNVMKTSILHFNSGAELALQSNMINTHYLFNSGLSYGDQITLSTNQMFNSGAMGGLSQFSITADTLINTGRLDGNNNNFNINSFYQQGIINLNGGLLKIENWRDNQNSSSRLNTLKVQGDSLTTQGNLSAEGVQFDLVNKVHIQSSANLELKDVSVKTSQLDHAGKINYQGQLKVETDSYQSQSGAEIRGQISENDFLTMPNHQFSLKSKQTVLAGAMSGGDVTHITSEQLKVAQGADIDISHGLVRSDETELQGNLNLTASRLESGKTHIEKDGELSLNQSVMQGDTLGILGELNADKAYLNISKSIVGEKSSTLELKEAVIETSKFDHSGKINYQGQCSVETQIFQAQNGSEIQGDISGSQQQLILQSGQTILGGKLSGGATQIITERLQVDREGDVNISRGYIKSGETEITGSLNLTDNSFMESAKTRVNQEGQYSLDHSELIGKDFISHGKTNYKQARIEEENIQFLSTATESVTDSNFHARNFTDNSHLDHQGTYSVETDTYSHQGSIKAGSASVSGENVFYLKSGTADLSGSAQTAHGVIEVEKFDQVSQLVAGSDGYSHYNFSKSLDVTTQAAVNLNDTIKRNCDVTVTGKSVSLNTPYNAKHTLDLCSTQGDVNILAPVNSQSLLVDSARDIRTNQSIQTDQLINFQAEGTFYNEKGKLSSDKVFIETGGNIENRGGEIRARDYAQLLADGDILNISNKHSHKGKYDKITEYDPALIEGGSGQSHEGLGLFVQAKGKVKSEASHFISQGDIYIDGAQGVQMEARYHTYRSKDKTHKKWYGKKTHEVETQTDIYQTIVHSDNGRTIIRSAAGGVDSVATIFSSKEGTDVYSQGTVSLKSLKTRDKHRKSKEKFWGLSKSSHKETIESVAPTLFVDHGTTRVHSELGDVDARGASFIGNGDLEIKAGKKILFGRDVLNHKITDKSQSLSVSVMGIDPVEALKSKQATKEALLTVDPTLSKVNQLIKSETPLEAGMNVSNLGLNVYNTGSQVMQGELLSRYGLGSPEGFNPAISLNLSQTRTTHQFQTLGSGGVNRNNVRLEAGEGIRLENGVEVHARQDMQIISPEIIASAAQLRSKFRQENRGAKIGVTMTGQVADVGASYAKQTQETRSHVNAKLSAEGHLDLGEVEKLTLKGANIEASSISGHVKKLEIETLQDVTRSSTKQFSASSSGQGSVYVGSESSRVVNQVSGIHVKEGINHDEKNSLIVDQYHSKGGVITSDGQNNFKAKEVTSQKLHDRHKKSGVGFSGNLHDLEGMAGSKTPETTSVSSDRRSVPVSTITMDHKDFKATQQSVIHGKQGTQTEIESIKGRICTDKADGYRIKKDVSTHLSMDVPLPQAEHKQNKSVVVDGPEKSLPISPEESQPVEIPLSDLHFDSAEQEQAFNQVVEKAADEFTATQKISPETQKKMGSILSTTLKLIKKGGEEGFDKLNSVFKNEHRAVRGYVKAKGLIFSFAMKAALESSKQTSTKGLLTEAAAGTVSDLIVDSALKLGKVGPLGWVMTGVDLVDGLAYDEEITGHFNEEAQSYIEKAFNTEDFQLQQVYLEMADNKLEIPSTMEVLHKTNQTLSAPGEFIKERAKKILTFGETPAPVPEPSKQSQNRFHLFNSSKKEGTQSSPDSQLAPG